MSGSDIELELGVRELAVVQVDQELLPIGAVHVVCEIDLSFSEVFLLFLSPHSHQPELALFGLLVACEPISLNLSLHCELLLKVNGARF